MHKQFQFTESWKGKMIIEQKQETVLHILID